MKNLLLITFLLFFSFSYAQEITMFDEAFSYRFYQDEERITPKELGELMLKDSLTKMHWKKAKTKNTIVNLLITAQVISFITIISSKENSGLPQILGPFIIVSSLANIGIVFTRQKSIRKAILRYNSLLDEPPKKKVVRANLKLAPALILDSNRINGGIGLNLSW